MSNRIEIRPHRPPHDPLPGSSVYVDGVYRGWVTEVGPGIWVCNWLPVPRSRPNRESWAHRTTPQPWFTSPEEAMAYVLGKLCPTMKDKAS